MVSKRPQTPARGSADARSLIIRKGNELLKSRPSYEAGAFWIELRRFIRAMPGRGKKMPGGPTGPKRKKVQQPPDKLPREGPE